MRATILALTSLLLALPQAAGAQLGGRRTAAGCVSVADPHARVSVSGRLILRRFAGPPNYESVAAGDAEERTFIVELPRAACIDDGGDFADPAHRFAIVQVSATRAGLMAALRSAIGRRVRVTGHGIAEQTGHHHAPLVLFADRLTVD